MAPMSPTSLLPQKRPLSIADSDFQASKKQRRTYRHHHTLRFKQQARSDSEPALLAQLNLSDEPAVSQEQAPRPAGRCEVDDFLDHSIISICEDIAGRDGIRNSAIDKWALETFRGCVEEYILDLCKNIRRPMLAARRTAPIATDLESAFHAVQVPPPKDQLPGQCAPKVPSPPASLPTPPPDDDFSNIKELPDSIIVSKSNTQDAKESRGRHIPTSFPAFPSQHTFQDTAVLPPRETDPRRIRELATEEGRLGEEALRKLATAGRGEGKLDLSLEADAERREDAQRGKWQRTEKTIEGIFEQTMKELARIDKAANLGDGIQDGVFEMAPIVNSERKFWMPDTSRRKTAPRAEHVNQTAKSGAEA